MKYLKGGSIGAAKQGGLKAEATKAVTRRQAISDEGSGERRATTTKGERVTTTIWTRPISDDERAASDVIDPISMTLSVGSWLGPEALL